MPRDHAALGLLVLLVPACGHGANTANRPVAPPLPSGAPPSDPVRGEGPPPRNDMPPPEQCDGQAKLRIARTYAGGAGVSCPTAAGNARKSASDGAVSVSVWRRAATTVMEAILSDESRDYRSAQYRATWTPGGVNLTPVPTTPPEFAEDARRRRDLASPEYARALRSLAAAVVGWPGEAVIGRGVVIGGGAPELAAPLRVILDARFEDQPAMVDVDVRFQGPAHESWGAVLVFGVTANARTSGARACGHPGRELRAGGELVVRARDGALVALRLHGPVTDSETPCAKAGQGTDPTATPKTCSAGDMSLDVSWSCVVAIPAGGPA